MPQSAAIERTRPGRAALLAGALLSVVASCGGKEANAARTSGFEDATAAAGIAFRMEFLPDEQGENFKINLYDHGCGVAAADYDGDGDDDLYFVNQLGANALYRNDGGGKFTDVTDVAGNLGLADRICVSAVFNDIDNDGDQDLYVTSTRGGNALFRNEGAGRFVDATESSGTGWVGHSQGATFFDADGDGDLDLLVTNTARWTSDAFHPRDRYFLGVSSLIELVESPVEYNEFFRNRGDGTFERRTQEANLLGVGWGGDTAVFDFDEDGDQDLFVGNMFGRSVLYRNDGKGHFSDVTGEVLGRTPWGTVGCKPFDYDGDGRLDLFVVDMHSDMWIPFDLEPSEVEEHRKYKGFHGKLLETPDFDPKKEQLFAYKTRIDYATVFFGNGLYRNLGGGRFEETSDRAGVETFWPWGIASGDFDADGYEDAFLPTGMGFPFFFWRSPLLRNRGDGTFEEISAAAGINPPPGGPHVGPKVRGRPASRSARSAATSDFDGDGRLDLVVNNFNDRPNLYINRWPAPNFVGFRLRGVHSNRDAVGAVVRIQVGGRTLVRQVDAAGGYLAQSSKTLHFGLGKATRVDRCEVRWPNGRVQTLSGVEVNRIHSVVEATE